jgi:F420-non-reducing hydrogenase small subunit
VYWTSGCGGCEAAFLDLGDRLLALERDFELAFFPLFVDRKIADLESYPDGAVDLALITGAIRTSEDVRMAEVLRRVGKTLVAFGACAQLGSVLGLADLVRVEALLRRVYGDDFMARVLLPHAGSNDAVATRLPELTPSVQTVEDVVPVDFAVPGCPPEVDRLWDVMETFGAAFGCRLELPERGSVLASSEATVCEDCSRQRPERKIARFHRLHEVDPDDLRCLLDEGLVCSGPATRGGCGAPCPSAGAPCRGCYGHPSGIEDQGARMLGALASVVDAGGPEGDPQRLRQETEEALDSLVDPVGTLYRYCFAHSLLSRLREPKDAEV